MKDEKILEREYSEKLLTDEELDMEVNRILRSIPELKKKYEVKEPFVVHIEGLDEEFNTGYKETEEGQLKFEEPDMKFNVVEEDIFDDDEDKEVEEVVYEDVVEEKPVLSERTSRILAGGIALFTMGAAILGISKYAKNHQKPDDVNSKTSISSEDENGIDPDKITINGTDYDLSETVGNEKTYVKEGNFDVDKLVTDEDGTVWVNQEAKDAYENSDKNAVNEIIEDGGSKVVDKDGNVVSESETNEIPSGYHRDAATGRIIKDGYTIDSNGDIIDSSKNVDESSKVGTQSNVTVTSEEEIDTEYEWAPGEYEKYINSDDYNCYVLDGKLYYGVFNITSYNSAAPVVTVTTVETKEETKEEVTESTQQIVEEVESEVEDTNAIYGEWAPGEFDKFINSDDFNCYELDGLLYYGVEPETVKTK